MEVARQSGEERISKTFLAGVPLLDPGERDWWLANWTLSVEPRGDGSHLQWAWERYDRIWADDTLVPLKHTAMMQILRVLDRYHWGYSAAFSYDPGSALEELSVPS